MQAFTITSIASPPVCPNSPASSRATASGATDTFALLSNLADAIESGTDVSGTVANGLTDLKAAYDQVNTARSVAGARGARLDLEATRLKTVADNREIERSGLEDTNITDAIAQLQKVQTILSATQASFTKLTSLSLFDYLK